MTSSDKPPKNKYKPHQSNTSPKSQKTKGDARQKKTGSNPTTQLQDNKKRIGEDNVKNKPLSPSKKTKKTEKPDINSNEISSNLEKNLQYNPKVDPWEDAFKITLNSEIMEAIENRHKQLTGDKLPEDSPNDVKTLREIYQKGKEIENMKGISKGKAEEGQYPTGSGKGQKYSYTMNGVDLMVRLDKQKSKDKKNKAEEVGKTYARGSLKGAEDKETQELADSINPYIEKQELLDAFMRGLKGQKDISEENEQEKEPYKAGVEARFVALVSDIMDNPGSSALSEKILENINTIEDYKLLYTGAGNENSYGALPSQNQTTLFARSANERTTVFNEVVTKLLRNGILMISSSNLATLRKLSSMLQIMPDIVKINHTKKEKPRQQFTELNFDNSPVKLDDFINFVKQQSAHERNFLQEEAAKRAATLLSDNENTDEEEKMIKSLRPEEQERRLVRSIKAANASIRKTQVLLDSKTKIPENEYQILKQTIRKFIQSRPENERNEFLMSSNEDKIVDGGEDDDDDGDLEKV